MVSVLLNEDLNAKVMIFGAINHFYFHIMIVKFYMCEMVTI